MRRLLALAVCLAGCAPDAPADATASGPSEAHPQEAPMALSAVPTFDLKALQSGTGPSVIDPTDMDARERLFDAMREAGPRMIDLSQAMSSTTDWREAEEAAARLVPQIPEPMRMNALRDAEHQLVHRLNSLPTLDPEALDALAEHTQALARLGSPEGDDVLRALIRLDGHLDDHQRGEIAGTAARHLGTLFTAEAECVGCTVEEALAGLLPRKRESLDPLLYEMQTVHSELVRIARVGSRGFAP